MNSIQVQDVVLQIVQELAHDSTHIVWFPGEIGYYVHTYLIYLVYIRIMHYNIPSVHKD